MENSKRVNLTHLLRAHRSAVMGFSGMLIVFFHCWITTVGEFPVIGGIEALLKRHGYVGVDVFVFLSGWGLTYSRCEAGGVCRFYAKRLRRVYLPYAEVTVVQGLLIGKSWRTILRNLSGVELLTRGIYAYQWFVPAILLVYAIYPLLKRLLDRSKNDLALLGGIIAAALIGGVLVNPLVPSLYWGILYRLPTFLMGVAAGRLGQRRRAELTAWQCAAMAGALLVVYDVSEYLRDITGLRMLRALQLSAFSMLTAYGIAGLCAWIEASWRGLFRIGRVGVRLLTAIGGVTLELYMLQGILFARILGMLEGRLTYLQINLINIVVIPTAALLLAWLNNRLLSFLFDRGGRIHSVR